MKFILQREQIRMGTQRNPCNCPIAICIAKTSGKFVSVGNTIAIYDEQPQFGSPLSDKYSRYVIPEQVKDFIYEFDSANEVERIEVEDKYAGMEFEISGI